MSGWSAGVGRVSGFARAVVAKRALVVAAVAGAANWAVDAGVLPLGWSERAQDLTGGAIGVVALVGAIFWVQSGTTPADLALRPVAADGRALVPATDDDTGYVGRHRAGDA